ncbi:winged helix-turn-helix transcriptional regulator [Bacillus sp. V3B]|uniref:helix-turn-helix transcriptional regulator n=1 Tax=Bacillus sp. V3B TaxID=2804915 RepID=UPI0021096BB7|nr:winged helix-turn-helix transcriptional regulator [Bacillus sp. V3B]MCQ6276546.1 winged helix-turn-helix transcriptional regulator [Bacillus sp. V3B]
MLMNTRNTKEQILSLLKKNGSLTIMELANELGITEMAVRRHIQTLERDKLIRSNVKKQTIGRPSKVYQLAEQGEDFFPKKYKEFSLEILQGLKEAGQEQLINDILLKKKERFIEQYKLDQKEESFKERIENLRRIQEYEGYMPSIENKDGMIHFKELNCPYVEIAKGFPQICQSEHSFIRKYLGADLTTLSSMAEGHTCCHYTIEERT